ncbi:MAG: deoxyribodipyrimidine photo-lyase [Thermoplasmatota archaeon]
MIHAERTTQLNDKSIRNGDYVVYWMQQSQRAHWNHAFERAKETANRSNQPLLVFFGITDDFPEANARHYGFMIEGLIDAKKTIEEAGGRFILLHGPPDAGIVKLAENASVVVVDAGYLRVQKRWRTNASNRMRCRMEQVESDVIVPVAAASPKEEYSAGTFRPKIWKIMDNYLLPLHEAEVRRSADHLEFEDSPIEDLRGVIREMNIDRTVPPSDVFSGGYGEASERLADFIDDKLDDYSELRSDPSANHQSDLSPYIHFGQISPLQIALSVMETGSKGIDSFLEELIVRRELAMNFVHYNEKYDSYSCLPEWAKKSLGEHSGDIRPYIYSTEELEKARTHDPYWNAAQIEMVRSGKMHNYMRMYWGKKIIEWTPDPITAFDTALYMNNRYSLDGRDPNSFAGIAWCFGKHDRPWTERSVFGKVRYMNDRGLKRKFRIDDYVDSIAKRYGDQDGKI